MPRHDTDMEDEGERREWHLDKKVPIAMILAIIVQTAGAVWWASKMESRVEVVEAKIEGQRDDPVRLARLEGTRDDVGRRLEKIEAKLDRMIELWGNHGAAK